MGVEQEDGGAGPRSQVLNFLWDVNPFLELCLRPLPGERSLFLAVLYRILRMLR